MTTEKQKKVHAIWIMAILLLFACPLAGQNQKVQLQGSDLTLKDAFKQIEQQAKLSVDYDAKSIDVSRRITKPTKLMTVETLLRQILQNTGYAHEYQGNHILIKSKNTRNNHLVNGIVKDAEGQPIIGANVSVKGTSTGTITDADGQFTVKAPDNAVLQISYIGYATQEISIGKNKKTIEITLKEDAGQLDEVVVIGYGTVHKRDLTTSVSVVSTEDLKTRPLTEAGGFIQGKVAGVTVQQTSGAPGSAMTVRVRGASSISSSNDPLYVVDGVPVGEGGYAISYLSPSDIESMQILKDASSASIYGSRAANGVVLITTKHGKKGQKPQISFNAYCGIGRVKRTYDVLNHEQYKELLMDEGHQAIVESMPFELKDETDWFKETYRNSLIQNYQVSASNASEKSKYYFSANYSDEKGVIRSSYNRNLSVRSNAETDLFKWLSVGANIAYTNTKRNEVSTGLGSNRGDVILTAICTPTYAKIWDEDNPKQYWTKFYGLSGLASPVENYARTEDDYTTYDRLIMSGTVTLRFSSKLNFKSMVSMDRRWTHTSRFLDPNKTVYGRQAHGEAYDGRADDRRMVYDNILTYNNTFQHKHNLEVMAGTSATTSDYQGLKAGTTYLMTEHINPDLGLAAGNRPYTYGKEWSQWTIMSYLGRISYNFDSKYYISANFRADGSSKLAPGHKWGFFPSVSAAWRMSSEHWLEDVSWISDLKLRAGWGQLGNQAGLNDYAWVQKYNISYYDYTKTEYATATPSIGGLNTMGNRDLTWESTSQVNLGIDFSILDNRISFILDGYYKYTKNLLLNVPLPSTAKVSSLYRNEGEMSNWGIELAVSSHNIVTKDFKWFTDFNISMNRNRLNKLSLQKVYYYAGTSDEQGKESVVRMEEGHPLSSFYGLVSKGVDPRTGNIVYEDRNNDGRITADDRTYIGDANPDFTFGMTNTLSYKNLHLSFLITGSVGNDIYNATRVELVSMNNGYNQITDVLRRWREPGNVTDMPKAGSSDNLKVSSRWIEDGSFLKVKNITLSYDFKNAALRKVNISKIQPYITLNNMLTFTKYTGYDPEVSQYTDATKMGIDWGSYPNVRSVVFGLTVDF